jgi:UDP-glucose:(heptosyl)LPS alpha-1,3-glucosyltransferase
VRPSVLLSRKTIITRGGAGQMMASQARFLKDRGYDVTVCCAKFGRGASKAFAGIRCSSLPRPLNALLPSDPRERIYESRVARLRDKGLLIDHGESIAVADIAYVHNYLSPDLASRIPGYVSNERLPWRGSGTGTILIANSNMVREALLETLEIPVDRVIVIYPGYDDRRFSQEKRGVFRDVVRQELGIGADEMLIGLVTSGDLHKRGLDRFVECFSVLGTQYPRLRGLVLGGRSMPAELASNEHSRSGRIVHQPVTGAPERYTAALDLVLYPARYEEFGIVILEAMAMGIPIVTSSAVGAAELLTTTAAELVIDAGQDSVEAYCAHTIDLLESDESTKNALGTKLSNRAREYSQEKHNARLAALVESIGS